MDSVNADVMDIQPESAHRIYSEDTPQLSEDNLDLGTIEKQLIGFALRKHKGNRRNAANALGISERTLYRKISDYGLE